MKVSELLSSEEKWTKEALARNADGMEVHELDDDACSWCLIGAIHHCYPRETDRNYALFKLKKSIYKLFGYSGVLGFNDNNATFEDVRKVVEDAAI
jgi:hypothetical protein